MVRMPLYSVTVFNMLVCVHSVDVSHADWREENSVDSISHDQTVEPNMECGPYLNGNLSSFVALQPWK